MKKIELKIVGLNHSQSQTNSYALVLTEVSGRRRLAIVIGHYEAQAIALELEKMKPTRPLTHDLFLSFANSFEISLDEVIITHFKEGIFYANLICNHVSGKQVIDSRTSDAVALAIRFSCPIYTTEEVMSQAGVFYNDDNEPEPMLISDDEASDSLIGYTYTELEIELNKALEEEDYERASQIRDELNKRK